MEVQDGGARTHTQPPKRSDTVHVTFHFYKSAVLLSLPGSTTLGSLKSHLLPALQPFSAILELVPTSEADIQLYEEKIAVEGAESQGELRLLDKDPQNKSLVVLGWPRWKRVFVSFRGKDGQFGEPVYTIPSPDDGEDEQEA
ncbi:hypothetical protein DB88DRAFT_376441 [Papiliotrema laurentii]|uniref:Uncharacterized protein n=1 Tax=Papiliotrema laurentii TaxID=5418 RepID=A0AAD9FQ90_PAPLA|nr:hypothetical protein DB88DRAFT_376441 [Papiliotrema laurentii]